MNHSIYWGHEKVRCFEKEWYLEVGSFKVHFSPFSPQLVSMRAALGARKLLLLLSPFLSVLSLFLSIQYTLLGPVGFSHTLSSHQSVLVRPISLKFLTFSEEAPKAKPKNPPPPTTQKPQAFLLLTWIASLGIAFLCWREGGKGSNGK